MLDVNPSRPGNKTPAGCHCDCLTEKEKSLVIVKKAVELQGGSEGIE